MDSMINGDVPIQENILAKNSRCTISPPLLPRKGEGRKGDNSLTTDKQVRGVLAWAGRKCRMVAFSGKIDVKWNYRFTAMLGRARFASNGSKPKRYEDLVPTIELSAKLWNLITDEKKVETIIHEACHLFVFEEYARNKSYGFLVERAKSHGPEWKAFMGKCGYPDPPVTHEAPSPTITKMYLVYCRCRRHFITPQMYGRMKKGQRLYCQECGADAQMSPYADET